MILSKQEQNFLDTLDNCDGLMPIDRMKPKHRSLVPRLRELGLLYRRDPEWAQLTKLGRSLVGERQDG